MDHGLNAIEVASDWGEHHPVSTAEMQNHLYCCVRKPKFMTISQTVGKEPVLHGFIQPKA